MGGPLVLIVEDSPVHQRLLVEAFERVGYTTRFDVQPDATGAWATILAMLRTSPNTWPRFAVIDVGLPGMSGIDLVDRIRHEPALAIWPLLVLTASSNPDDEAESNLASATAYFRKPIHGGYEPVVREMLDFLGTTVGWDARAQHSRAL